MSQALMAQKQAKLALIAKEKPAHRFTNLYSLLHWNYWISQAAETVLRRSGSNTAGIDGQTKDAFKRVYTAEISSLVDELKRKIFIPVPVRRTFIPKKSGDRRPLGIPALRDRIVQEALRAVLDPIFESDFCHHSYGFRKGRRTMDAITAIMPLVNTSLKYYYVIEGDIKSYFDTVQHRKLLSLLKQRIADRDIIDLIAKFLNAGVMEERQLTKTETGVPQGGVISPLLANVYLHQLDKWAEARWNITQYERWKRRQQKQGNYKLIRYADDFVIISNDRIAGVRAVREEVKEFLKTELHLELSEEKTKLTHLNEGITFLGFSIRRVKAKGKWAVHLRPTKEAKERVKARIKDRTLRRKSTQDEYVILRELKTIVNGWAEYYKFTSLAKDIEEIANYADLRYSLWLRKKHKKKRRKELFRAKAAVIHNRKRWVAKMQKGNKVYTTHLWYPTRKELKRGRYMQKGKGGFSHPYLESKPNKKLSTARKRHKGAPDAVKVACPVREEA